MGACVLVRNNEDGKLYVIKQVDLTKMNRKERQQSLNEAHLLKSLQHPNVINYVDSFLTNKSDYICIVMEYADGGDLSSRIKKSYGVNFRETQVIDWIIQLALSLSYVHKRKVLHRDVKSQNVFLTSQNILKLGDFGIARTLSGTYDQAKTFVGTPYYLSPELIMERPYDHRSDVWALGVIVYELLTLKHPFNATSMKGLMQRILKLQYEPIPPLYTTELRNIVPRLLTRDPAHRIRLSDLLDLPVIHRRLREWMLSDVMPKDYIETLLRNGLLPSQVAALRKSAVVPPAAPTTLPARDRTQCLTPLSPEVITKPSKLPSPIPAGGNSPPLVTDISEGLSPKLPQLDQRQKQQQQQQQQQQTPSLQPSQQLNGARLPSQDRDAGAKKQQLQPKHLYINYKKFNGGYNSSSVSGNGVVKQNSSAPNPMCVPSGPRNAGVSPSNAPSIVPNSARHFTAILGPGRQNGQNVVAAPPQSSEYGPTGHNSNAIGCRGTAQPSVVPNSIILQRLAEHRAHKRSQQETGNTALRLNPFLHQPNAPAPLPYLAGVQQLDIRAMLQRATLERARRNAT